MIDRTTKILLGLIALGLLANVAVSLNRPAVAQTLAQENALVLRTIAGYVEGIANGTCRNGKLLLK
jgi:hypothetical protein